MVIQQKKQIEAISCTYWGKSDVLYVHKYHYFEFVCVLYAEAIAKDLLLRNRSICIDL